MGNTSRARSARARRRISPERPTNRYREQYGIIILCDDERHQARVYEALRRQRYQCRVVVT